MECGGRLSVPHLHEAEGQHFLTFCTPGTSLALPMSRPWFSTFSLVSPRSKYMGSAQQSEVGGLPGRTVTRATVGRGAVTPGRHRWEGKVTLTATFILDTSAVRGLLYQSLSLQPVHEEGGGDLPKVSYRVPRQD